MLKRVLAVLLMFILVFSVFAVQAEEEAGEAVLGGELIYDEGDDEPSDFVHEAYVPDGVEKKPIGRDDRYSVDVRAYPYCAVAYIVVHKSCGCEGTGTGFLVGPSGLMTAGHVVHCNEHNGDADQFTIYFGYKSNRDYLVKYTKGTTYWYNDTNNSNSEEYDWAFIKLQERVGDSMGWFGVSARSDLDLDLSVLYAAGYRHGVLMGDYDWVYVNSPYEVKHTIDTEPGYSGCPIYTNDYYAVAINVAHSIELEYNYGCRITNWMVNQMRSYGAFD